MRTRTLAATLGAAIGLGALPASAPALTVFAAQSLNGVFPAILAAPTYSFAGSDALATQIRGGAPADVFASANMSLPTALYKDHLCTKPVVFATNTLVLITPTANPTHVRTVFSLGRAPRRTVAIGSATVPIGIYTRQTLRKLGIYRSFFAHNTVSDVPNVGAVKTAVESGGADAGFVYYSDWLADKTLLKRFRVPAAAQAPVRYGICIVRRTGADTAGARRFITRVRSAAGRQKLRQFGFGVPRR